MKRIPNLELTDEEYVSFLKRYITRGGEGIICPGTRKDTLLKIFIDISGKRNPMSENKERKISHLFQLDSDSLVKPLRTISYKGQIIGYEMSYNQLDKNLNELVLPRKELIEVLKKSRDILLSFRKKDITYGDVTENNILYNPKTRKVKFCDIDNMRIGNLPIDIRGFSLNKFYSHTGTIDEKADAYMHNLLTIRSLSYPQLITYDTEIIGDLQREIYPTKFKQQAKEIFKSMITPETFNGEYVIQYIKR